MLPPHIAQAPPCLSNPDLVAAKSLSRKGGGACAAPTEFGPRLGGNGHRAGGRPVLGVPKTHPHRITRPADAANASSFERLAGATSRKSRVSAPSTLPLCDLWILSNSATELPVAAIEDPNRTRMRPKVRRAFLICVLALGGCQTPYQQSGLRGGVKAEPLSDSVFRVTAAGNAYTSRSTVQDYVLLKAAETTLERGGTHFVLGESEDQSKRSVDVHNSPVTVHRVGNMALATGGGSSVTETIKPGQAVLVTVLSVADKRPVPPGAISAEEIVRNIAPRVQRG